MLIWAGFVCYCHLKVWRIQYFNMQKDIKATGECVIVLDSKYRNYNNSDMRHFMLGQESTLRWPTATQTSNS